MAERAWRWRRRQPVLAGLTAAVVAAVLAIICGLSTFAVWEGRRREVADNLTHDALNAKQDAIDRLADSLRDQGRALRLSRQAGQRWASLDILEQAARLRPSPASATKWSPPWR